MEWVRIPIAVVRSAAYVGSEPALRGTWLNLMAWCAEQENGGIITDCAEWNDRRWQQTLGATKSEVESQCDLWHWEGNNLCLHDYPLADECALKAKRKGGSKGGRKSTRQKYTDKHADKHTLPGADKHANNRVEHIRKEKNRVEHSMHAHASSDDENAHANAHAMPLYFPEIIEVQKRLHEGYSDRVYWGEKDSEEQYRWRAYIEKHGPTQVAIAIEKIAGVISGKHVYVRHLDEAVK